MMIKAKQFNILAIIRRELTEQLLIKVDRGANPLRANTLIWSEYVDRCNKKQLPIIGANLSLGNIDANSFDRESEDLHLSQALGICPDGEIYRQISLAKEKLNREYYFSGRSLSKYGEFAGIEEVRAAFAEYLAQWGGIVISKDATFFSSGEASDMAQREIEALVLWLNEERLETSFLTTVPGYMPIINMARKAGMRVITLECSEANNYFLQSDQARQIVQDENIGVFYIVPINNPTGTMVSADQLSRVVRQSYEANTSIIFLVDLAYITTVSEERAHTMLAIFNNKEILERTIFLTSLSKSHAIPGQRLGACHTIVVGMNECLRIATESGNPCHSSAAMLEAVAVLNNVNKESVRQTATVYKRRREMMIDTLKDINRLTNQELFINLDKLKTDGA
ncbi:MAG: Aspartate/tyrosine/aromaticaminotransferase [Candidatus Falkowbacteria bacterium GW2011_GWA2_39_24]|uniref:Aminotransferase n=1 Tax=Candidatus Falkowbacteria bacterium GW2011_GWA2_39_24 TaxID=1618634 RepID=A0A0G0NH33_9BACT|nr:MAG: Aspartate/tyrosine/aromaticaminotransferase [Candidatus Falkowbacteria bacterium GW2011_GWA2_39_24]